MPHSKSPPILVDLIAVSGDPGVREAVLLAARTQKEHLRTVQVGTELSELPGLLERLEAPFDTLLVFLEHPPVATPALLEAAERINQTPYFRYPSAPIVILLARKDTGDWPRELGEAGVDGLLTPPFGAERFAMFIRRVTSRCG